MSELTKNIQKIIDDNNLEKTVISRKAGMSHRSLGMMLEEKSKNPSIYKINNVCKVLGVYITEVLPKSWLPPNPTEINFTELSNVVLELCVTLQKHKLDHKTSSIVCNQVLEDHLKKGEKMTQKEIEKIIEIALKYKQNMEK